MASSTHALGAPQRPRLDTLAVDAAPARAMKRPVAAPAPPTIGLKTGAVRMLAPAVAMPAQSNESTAAASSSSFLMSSGPARRIVAPVEKQAVSAPITVPASTSRAYVVGVCSARLFIFF